MTGSVWGGAGSGNVLSQREIIQIACSDLATILTPVLLAGYFRVSAPFVLLGLRASLSVASTAGALTIDVNKNGVSIVPVTKITIAALSKTSVGSPLAVITDAAMTDDAEITIDIDAAGANAKGLIVTFLGNFL